jgi:hypothetical protein
MSAECEKSQPRRQSAKESRNKCSSRKRDEPKRREKERRN